MDRRADCALATGVHDVDVRIVHAGEGHQMMDALGFDNLRPRGFVPLGARPSFGQQFLLQFGHQLGTLAMRGDDHAKLPG